MSLTFVYSTVLKTVQIIYPSIGNYLVNFYVLGWREDTHFE